MTKLMRSAAIMYALYCIIVAFYLFAWSDASVPSAWKGTDADPATFLSPHELRLSEQYSQWKNFLYFISLPYEWLLYVIVLAAGISKALERWAARAAKRFIWQVPIYVFWFSLFAALLTLPLDWLGYRLSRAYGVSTQPMASWLRDEMTDFFVGTAFTVLLALVVYGLIRRFERRWWLYAWLMSIPLTLFVLFIQPVVIDPLYNDFYPLQNKKLEDKILALAEQANIPADHVFEVNMSEKTNALNAYVTGIGSHARIVLWDTTLERLEEDEVLFIMAHEMGHYVMKHVYWGAAGSIALAFFGLWAADRLLRWALAKWGPLVHLHSMKELASLPLLLLMMSLLQFSVTPLINAVSRHEEHAADKYAVELTKNPEAAISAFQKLTQAGRSQVHPPALVKWIRYTHPTIFERIVFLESVRGHREQTPLE